MLFAGGRLTHGRIEYASSLTLERTFRIYTVERRVSLWDTRFVRAQTPGTGFRGLQLVLGGWIQVHLPSAARVDAPFALVAPTPPADGPVGPDRLTLTAGGEPFQSVQLAVNAEHWTGPEPSTPTPVVLPGALADAARALLDLDAPDRLDRVGRFLDEVAGAGLVARALSETIVAAESKSIERIWRTVTDSYLDLSRAPSMQEIATRAGLSERQVARDVDAILAAFGVPWRGFRELSSDLRLRWAVLLLSVPDVSAREVARAAAYGSANALNRALRDAGLPSAEKLRREILTTAGPSTASRDGDVS